MQVNIRIRDDLYKKLKEEAKKHHRTITAQLEIILLNALEIQEKNSIEIPKKTYSQPIESYDDYNRQSIDLKEKEEDPYAEWK